MNTKIASSSSETLQRKSRQSDACRVCRKLLDLYSRQGRKAGVDYVRLQTIWNTRMLLEHDPIVQLKELRRRTLCNFMQCAAPVESLQAAPST